MNEPTIFKVLDGLNPNVAKTTYRYPGVGRWTRHLDPDRLEVCVYGYHYTTGQQVLDWLGPDIYEAEPCQDHAPVHDQSKSVTCRLRLVRRFDGWDESTARLFAADCTERVLPLFEAAFPGDDRPRQAIVAARRFARGEISRAAARAAGDAAGDAAWAAAGAASGAASEAAARDAARDWQYQRLLHYLGEDT